MKIPLLNYCLVKQNLASIIEDSTYDSDRFPDVSDISGEVIFTPNIANGKAYQLFDSQGDSYTVPVSRIRAKIVNGEIIHEDSPGVYLFAAGPGSNPDRITYSVEYRNLRSGDQSFALSPLRFEAIPGGEVDLTMATPVIGATPAGTTKGDKGDKGDPFLYEDFTPEQIDDLKGPLTLADLTPERLETIKGPQGDRGPGIHSVSVDGSDLVFTVDENGIVEVSRVPLVEAANGIRDEISDDLTASKNAVTAAEGYANQSASSASDSASSASAASSSASDASNYKDISLSAAERAEFAAEETIQQVEGDFATRNYTDSAVENATSSINEQLKTRLVLGSPEGDGVWKVGTSESIYPWYQGLVTFDDFRTPGEVVGSSSTSGNLWGGYGSWISDGEVARATEKSGLAVDATTSNFTVEADLAVTTSALESAQSWRLYYGASTNLGNDGVWIGLNISNTGVASLSVYVTSGGVSRQLVGYTGLSTIGVVGRSDTPASANFRLYISGRNVVINATGKDGVLNLSGELTAEEAAGLGTWFVVKSIHDSTPGFALDEILVETSPRTSSEPVKLVSVGDSGVISENVLPDRLSEESLIQLVKNPLMTDTSGGLDELAAKIAFGGAGQHSIGVVSDSSMNDGVDSLRIFDRKISKLLPTSVRHIYHNWNTADAGWRHTTNIEGEVDPGHDGTVLVDTFSRVTSSLVGSTPDIGAAWGGTGAWSTDGQYARASGKGKLTVDANDRSMKLGLDMQVSLADAVDQRLDLILGTPSDYSYGGMMLTISIGSTGSLSFVPYVWDGKWTRAGDRIYGSSVGIPAASATVHSVSVTISIDIQNITIDVKGPSATASTTAQMTESQYASSGSWLRIEAVTEDTSAIALDKISVLTAPQDPQGDTLDVWNGAIAGAKLASFDDARIESMFGDKNIDILMVSMGHNHRTQSPSDFLEELELWIGLWKQKHPETKYFIWVSQNPQFPPASSVLAHRDRQRAVRLEHRNLGMDYVGGYESISKQPDGGSALILADGIHPTTPPVGVTEGEYGAVKVAEAIIKSITNRI